MAAATVDSVPDKLAEIAPKTQRLRDPVHGLIVFPRDDELAQLIWRLLNAREFQRLRRIRQLGFSALVFPGATHTRFAHSVGVSHMARTLAAVLKRLLGVSFDDARARIAICAALLHDLGHGPFSHTFEGVMKQQVQAGSMNNGQSKSLEAILKSTRFCTSMIQPWSIRSPSCSRLSNPRTSTLQSSQASSMLTA